MSAGSTDWEAIYARGEMIVRWPCDYVVQFVMRNRPDRPAAETRVLEVGFGTGNNLWMAAMEGLSVAGVEQSETAVVFARERLQPLSADGELHVGSFAPLPFDDDEFDLAIDRAALSCVSADEAMTAIREIRRILRPGGRFLFNPYSSTQTERSGYVWPTIEFYDEGMVSRALGDGWRPVSREHAVFDRDDGRFADWRVIVEKVP